MTICSILSPLNNPVVSYCHCELWPLDFCDVKEVGNEQIDCSVHFSQSKFIKIPTYF